ncbi:MAG: hypothetical protein FJ110_09970 [Deltaproteobacteria bacterium]|nr:hypothetical protein [Deltaproteobacteria bacterium]
MSPEKIEEAILTSAVNGYLPCPVALRLSLDLNVESKMVGETINKLGVKLTDCMLGCFKIKKSQHEDLDHKLFSQEVMKAIQSSLVDNHLPCKVAHDLGRKTKIGLREIGDAATKMKIKISDCQLGCF